MTFNPGIIWAFHSILMLYITLRFYQVGQKGSRLAQDVALMMFLYTLAFLASPIGFFFFLDDPFLLTLVAKIGAFFFWYLGMVATAPVFSKTVNTKISPLLLAIFIFAVGVFLTVYHLTRLELLTVVDGIPQYHTPSLVSITNSLSMVLLYVPLAVSLTLRSGKSRNKIRAVFLTVGWATAAIFGPTIFIADSRELFVFGHTLIAVALILLAFGIRKKTQILPSNEKVVQ